MKKLVLILCFFICFLTGCDNVKSNDTTILFNDEPFSKDNFNKVKTVFKAGERIYYLFVTGKEIKSPYIRVQVSSVVDKSAYLYYKPVWAGDYKVMLDEMYFYTNYVVMNSKGKYLIQIFGRDNLHKPLAFAFFIVN